MNRLGLYATSFVFIAAAQASWADTVVEGSGSTFVMTYHSDYSNAYQSIMNDAAQVWADLVRSDVPIEVYIDATNQACSFASNSHVDTRPPANAINFPNAPLADTYYPIALANSIAGEDLRPGEVDIHIRYNRNMINQSFCKQWDLGKDGNYHFLEYSLYFETLQEIAHGLGIIPLGNLMTGEKLNGLNDIYWLHLKSEQTGKMLSDMTPAEIVVASHTLLDITFKGEKSFAAGANLGNTVASDGLYMFTRTYDLPEITGFHLLESTVPNQVLLVDMRGSVPETDVTLAMLEDLGWRSTRNAVPSIEAQADIQVIEDSSYALTPEDFIIADEQPDAVTLSVLPGDNYDVAGSTITPNPDFAGELEVGVTASDGELESEPFTTRVQVVPVNDAPTVTAQQTLTTLEDTTLTLTPNDFTIVDVDSTTFTLQLTAGENYSIDGATITPAQDYFGTLTVPVTVSDGTDASAVFNASVNVTAVNDAPVITNQQVISVEEESPLTITPELLSITDVDSSVFTVTVLPGANYTATGDTLTPATDFNGTLLAGGTVSDGIATSNTFVLSITVIAKNDPPVLTGFNPIQIDEDTSLTLDPALLQFTDIDSDQFYIVANSGDNYSVSDGVLTPAQDFFGTLTVPMQVSDTAELSNSINVSITVNAVNDAPVIESVTPQSILEDTSLFVSEQILSIIDPDSSDFSVSLGLGEHYQIAGNEIIPDANWFGVLNIPVTINDGELDSNTANFELTVESVNDLPELITAELPLAQIYRPFDATLTATDDDNDALTFVLSTAPSWVTLTETGRLRAFPTENMTGTHDIAFFIDDGSARVEFVLTLTVQDDPTVTDLGAGLDVARTIWSTEGFVPVDLTLANIGPMASVDATISIDFAGEWTTQDPRCSVALNHCELSIDSQESIALSVSQSVAGSNDLTVSVSHNGFDYEPFNNEARITLTFTPGIPTSPQYTVPSFGQGTVRAIGIANVQGGRWPEILFANGATEASTVYKFSGSIFRPVLHSHLADASDSYGMAIVDLDNDGDNDWVLANGNGEANTIYLNNGAGFFELTDALGLYDSRAVAFGDMDRDGDMDLVFANNEDPNTLYLNNGDGTFELFAEFTPRYSRGVLVRDFNRDGFPDIVFANRGFRNRILFNRGVRAATAARSIFGARSTSGFDFDPVEFGLAEDLTTQIALADLDGDGDATDLISVNESDANTESSMSIVKVQSNEQTFEQSRQATGSVTDISVGDYDGDGRDDVAVLRPGGALEMMQASPTGLSTFEVMDTDGADTILMVDIDGSGQADVISANNRSESSRLDFTGNTVIDAEPELNDASADVALPATPEPSVSQPMRRSGGAGIPWVLGLVLLLARRLRD